MPATEIGATVREKRRAAALDRIADHMLAHGLAPSSLRALGAAAGSSDRMLLYYFADKDEIVVQALHTITARLAGLLAVMAPGDDRSDPPEVLRALSTITRSDAVRPYMRVWLELTVLSSRGEQPFRRVGGQIADAFLAWVAARLDIGDPATRDATAARLIATIDGLIVLDCVDRTTIADLALDWLAIPG